MRTALKANSDSHCGLPGPPLEVCVVVADFTSDEIMTVAETAKWLRCGRRNIYRMAREGKIPHLKIGKFILFRRRSVDAWLAEREVKT